MNLNLDNIGHWRCIGPFRGGRVVTVAGDPNDIGTFYFGACAGGIWKPKTPVNTGSASLMAISTLRQSARWLSRKSIPM